ncbi:unnamed protein product [Phytomonas sp. EM1]|nr:unnamed protein product [Phytomonas sp. EM1]|eukprot:CCW62630.1 unnamed protein product [Phytomonas sp. isolate EM1]
MRGLTKLYTYACEEMGCISNSELVRYFTSLDYMDDIEAAYPTCLDLRHNYLGDAGAAACFRVLPYMMWVRRVEAANIGCGPLGVKALCAALALRTSPASKCKANLAYANPLEPSTQVGTIAVSMAPVVVAAADGDRTKQEDDGIAFAVVPLEYIDLSGNPIYAQTAGELLKALRLRRDWLRRCYGNGIGDAATPLPLQLVLDWDVLPRRTVARLQSMSVSAPEGYPSSHSHNHHLPHRTSEERNHNIYRILTAAPLDDDESDPSYTQYDTTNPFLATLVGQVNEHMRDYLLMSYHIEPGIGNDESVDELTPAAAYLCAEYGVDLLPYLFTQSQFSTGGIQVTSLSSSSNCGEEMMYNRVMGRVRTLFQALDATPQLLQEALARDHDGPLLRYYLDRLRTFFDQLASCNGLPSSHSTSWERLCDFEALYHRVVSSLVCRRMEWTLLPVIETSEARIDEITKYMVEYLLDGVCPSSIYEHKPQNHEDISNEVLFCGALTRWCAQAMYHIHNEPKSHAEWNCVYKCMVHRLFKMDPSGTSDINEDSHALDSSRSSEEMVAQEDPKRSFEEKRGEAYPLMQSGSRAGLAIPTSQVQARDGEGTVLMQFPCDRHCQLALRALYKVLKDPYTVKRLEVVAPLQKALPIEMRHFLVDLLICQNSRGVVGGPYVAELFGEPSSLESFVRHREGARSDEMDSKMEVVGSFRMIGWSLVDILAVLYNRQDRLMELLKVFTEWYRLRTIESLVSRA